MVFDEYRVLLCGNVVDEYGESDGYLMAALFSFGIGDTPDKNSLMVTWAKTYGGKGNQALNDFCVINNIFWATGKNDSSTSLLEIDMANGTLQNKYDFNIGANSSGLALFPYKNNVGICGQFYDKPTRSLQGYVIAVNNIGLPQSFQVLENIFPYSASHSPINNQIILAGSKNNLMWLGSF
jgi:hypothetical protein